MTIPVMLRVDEVADWIGCSSRTVQRMIRAGTLASVKIGGMRRVPGHAVEHLLGGEAWMDEAVTEPRADHD